MIKVNNKVRKEDIKRVEVRGMDGYNTANIYYFPKEGRKGKLRLDFNENIVGCSPKVITAIRNISAEDIAIYPEYNKFKAKLAGYLKVDSAQLILTNGADEGINLVFNAYLDKNDEVIIPTPSFEMLNVYAQNIGAKVVSVLYNVDNNFNNRGNNNAFSFPTENVLTAINKKTKLVVIVSRNNPTGTIVKENEIIKIIEKAAKNNAIVLIDEAYYQFYGKTCLKLINKYDNLILVQTFSKAFGLAGLRLGYIVSNKKSIENIKKILSPYNVNSVAVIAANSALDDINFVERYVKEVKKSKKYVQDELAKLGIKTFPSVANFIIVNFGDKINKVINGLEQKGILVRDRAKVPLVKDCVWRTIGTREQSAKLINEIKKILRENKVISKAIRKKVILFDLDGVLVDVSKSYQLAIKKTAEFFTNQKISDEKIQKYKDKSGYNNDWNLTEAIILDKRIQEYNENKVKIEKQKIIDKFQWLYLGNNNKKGLIEDEKLLLDREKLKILSEKYKLGIVTGRPKEEAYYVLRRFNILGFFNAVVTMEDCGKKQKPDPFGINLALQRLKVDAADNKLGTSKNEYRINKNNDKKNAVYIGDNIDDIIAAKNAGIKAIGILPRKANSDVLRRKMTKNGAIDVLNDVNKIVGVVQWTKQ